MSFVVLSPHLDDAVLSFGGALAARDPHCSVAIATVLAGSPPAWSWPTPFDNASGFSDSQAAIEARRLEDVDACDNVHARPIHLGFLDGQYGIANDEDFLVEVLADLFRASDHVAVPLGLAHPDHRLAAKCCQRALSIVPPRMFAVYAEMPAARLWPGHIPGALKGWERAGWLLEPYEWPLNLERKRQAWEQYSSQHRFPELAWENLTEERGWLGTLADAG